MDNSRSIDLEVVTVASIISCVLADTDPPVLGQHPPCPLPRGWGSGRASLGQQGLGWMPQAGTAILSDPQCSPRRGRFVLFHSQHLVAHFQVLAPRHRQVINVSEEPLRYWLIWLFPSQRVFMVSRPTVTIVTSHFFPQLKAAFPAASGHFIV